MTKENILLLVSTPILVILIIFVYINNRNIHELTQSSTNVNQYILKGEANDNHMFNSSTNIVKYLKARDYMKADLEVLKQKIRDNEALDIKQNKRLKDVENINKAQNDQIEFIKTTYRSDIKHIVERSLVEVNRHLPNQSDGENLRMFRELLFKHVLMIFKEYNELIPNYDLKTFINVYGEDLAFIIAQSIYKYKIYNIYDNFPIFIALTNEIANELKDPLKRDFIMRTYFSRMFNYIEVNKDALFAQHKIMLEGSPGHLFSNSQTDPFAIHIKQDTGIDFTTINRNLYNYLFVLLPTYYTKALYYNSDNNVYLKDLEDKIILLALANCDQLREFHTTWLSYNSVKTTDAEILIETEKTKLLKKLIDSNSIFKKIYEDQLKKYNIELNILKKNLKCDNLPILPEKYRYYYMAGDVNVLPKSS